MPTRNSKSRLIGLFDLGCRKVRLYARPGASGGCYDSAPSSGVAEIRVCIDYPRWQDVAAVLAHEALEMAFAEMGLRYSNSPDYSGDNGGWFFAMTHTQFSEASARAAWFLAGALPALAKAYRRGRR